MLNPPDPKKRSKNQLNKIEADTRWVNLREYTTAPFMSEHLKTWKSAWIVTLLPSKISFAQLPEYGEVQCVKMTVLVCESTARYFTRMLKHEGEALGAYCRLYKRAW